MKSSAFKGFVLCIIAVLLSSLFPTFGWSQLSEKRKPELQELPTFLGIAKYYDNRTFACTVSWDDYTGNHSKPWKLQKWQDMFNMFNSKNLTYNIGVITDYEAWGNNWTLIQENFDDGKEAGQEANTPYLMEVSSHSVIHSHPNNWDATEADYQIGTSACQIKDNLRLQGYWEMNGSKYVLSWIEPYGESTATTRFALGGHHYLADRATTESNRQGDYQTWDSTNGLFNRWGVVLRIDAASVQHIKDKFDWAHINGKIFCVYGHPATPRNVYDWNITDGNADKWTDYISGDTSCWYCHLGTLYTYRYIVANPDRAISISSSETDQEKVFNITVTDTIHERYGLKYPVTYVFSIPSDWATGCVFYRYGTSQNWTLMASKSSSDFFNGIVASRFDFTKHRAYVSAGFSDVSHNIYLQLCPHKSLEVPKRILELIEVIETWNLSKGIESGLTSKLDGAIYLLEKDNEDGAIHKLMDFIEQVEAQREKKLTDEQADYLISETQRITDLVKG